MKKHLSKILLSLAMVFVFILVAGASCKIGTTPKEEPKEETVKIEEEVQGNWTSATDKGSIPDIPIAGRINRKDVTIAAVQVTKWEDEYSWTFSNIAPDEPCGVLVDNSAVNFSSKVFKEGTFEKKLDEEVEFEEYHSYYHYEQEDGTPMSVNVEWSSKIVISKIDETNKKISGWAKFDFGDGQTSIAGSFTADLCE
ncbi:MAG: hypothetical protein ACD_63C00022G0002 [uncultured bacterium]|nr:MAG: hypothetical protein ACD_63C00022G0002 [uncultured bacterium]